MLLPLLLSPAAIGNDSTDAQLQALTQDLQEAPDDAARLAVVQQLLSLGDSDQAQRVVDALSAGKLCTRRADNQLVLCERDGRVYRASALGSGEDMGELKRREVRRISSSGSLRQAIGRLRAEVALNDGNPEQRLQAVRRLMSEIAVDQQTSLNSILQQRLSTETDGRVLDQLRRAAALALLVEPLQRSDAAQRKLAIEQLHGDTDAHIRQQLQQLHTLGQLPAEELRLLSAALQAAEDKLRLYGWIETLLFGLSLGSVLVLAGIGLAITFGVMGVINTAHGELIMLGAYTTYSLQVLLPNQIGLALILSIPAAFMVSALVGVAIERGVVRRLYERPLETLLATFGVSLVLQQAVRTIFSPLNRAVSSPEWLSGSIQLVEGLSITSVRLWVFIFTLMSFVALLVLLKRTRFGLHVRAVSQNRQMAAALGVRSARVDALTFALGSGFAGLAGVALSQLTNVGPNMGQAYIIDSFLVVVLGGVGNLWGTLVAGLSMGVFSKVFEPLTGAVLTKVLVLLGVILIIQRRPQGLFPQRGRTG